MILLNIRLHNYQLHRYVKSLISKDGVGCEGSLFANESRYYQNELFITV